MRLRDRMPFHFIKLRRYWYLISILVILPGVISLCLQGLNKGIDFTGGNLLELRFKQHTTTEQVRVVLGEFGLQGDSIQQSSETDFLIRTKELSEDENNNLIKKLDSKLGGVTVQRSEHVGAVISGELIWKAILALLAASLLIVIYVAWRFEFKQGLAAIMAMLHDILVVLGVFSIFHIEVDSAFVAAILTIVGYSIMDTIIIFDRVRENNLNRKKGEALEDIINKSMWQTMARSINTILAVLFVLLALYFMGGATIHNLVLALLIGVVSGAYSSICNATPLWFDLKRLLEGGNKPGAAKA